MAKSCGGSIVKILLAVFNAIWLALGAFVIYLGTKTFQYNKEDYFANLVNTNLQTGAIVLLVFGSVVVLLALIGFVGACCESFLLLNVYAGLLCLVLVANCVGIYFGYRYQDEFKDRFSSGVKNAIKDSFNNANPDPTMAYMLQEIQYNLQCCGWESPQDYTNALSVPASCCNEDVSRNESLKLCSKLSIQFTKGCTDSPVVSFLKSSAWVSAYSLILIQVIIILAACCLARDLNSYTRVNQSD